jgi:hypothetical protein
MADLDPSILDKARALAVAVLDAHADDDVYWKTVDVPGIFVDAMVESSTATQLYLIFMGLTDIWELSYERREEAASLMRDAARELLKVSDAQELDAYVIRWKEKLA